MIVSPEIQRIADAIRQAVPTEKLYLFGSYAYGTPHENSDYDFYIIIPDGSMRPIEAMQEAQRALIPFGAHIPDVDVLAGTQSKFDQMRGWINTVERDIAAKGVLLYERHGLGAQVA